MNCVHEHTVQTRQCDFKLKKKILLLQARWQSKFYDVYLTFHALKAVNIRGGGLELRDCTCEFKDF